MSRRVLDSECQIQDHTRTYICWCSFGSDIRNGVRNSVRTNVKTETPASQFQAPSACGLQWPPGLRPHDKRGGNIGAKSRELSHGRPSKSRGWLPLPTCQNEGFPRVFSPLTRRQSWLTSGYQRGFRSEEIPPGERLKAARKPPFQGQKATARLLSQTGGSVRRQAWGAIGLKA